MAKKRVLITGASRGIGRELTRQLSELGHAVFATARDDKLLAELKRDYGCFVKSVDLRDSSTLPELFCEAISSIGGVDVLINNAGLNHIKSPVSEIEDQDWDLQYEVNLRAPYVLCREAMKHMQPERRGHIVNVISTVAKTSMANYSIYTTMKYGLMGFTKCLTKEALKSNIKVTAVYPGGVNSDFREEERPQYMTPESTAKMIIHCIMAPEDVVVHEITYRPMVEDNF